MDYFFKSKFLKGKQEDIQKRSFTKWINSFLVKYSPSQEIYDLFDDLKDGIKLLLLLQLLSKTQLTIEFGDKNGDMKIIHHVSNVNTALKFLESKEIKLVNINSSDVVSGKPSIVLGLIWTIILHFQIEQSLLMLESFEIDTNINKNSSINKRANTRKVLLKWANDLINTKYGLDIKDFGKSWTDGKAFNALIHGLRPDLVDMEIVKFQSPYKNLEAAFEIAEKQLDVPKLLEPEDIDVENPDEKVIMMYVSKIAEKYPRHSNNVNPMFNLDNQISIQIKMFLEWISLAKERLDQLLIKNSIQATIEDHLLLDKEIQMKYNEYKDFIKSSDGNLLFLSIENNFTELKTLSNEKQNHLFEVEKLLNERSENMINIKTNISDACKMLETIMSPSSSINELLEKINQLKIMQIELNEGKKKKVPTATLR